MAIRQRPWRLIVLRASSSPRLLPLCGAASRVADLGAHRLIHPLVRSSTHPLIHSQIQARIEELATDAASQPKAVQAAVRAAVRESEERAEQRVGAVHQMYEKAAAEQQIQIKELLRMTQSHAKERHDALLAAAVREVKERAEEEKRITLEQVLWAWPVAICDSFCFPLLSWCCASRVSLRYM